MARTQTVFSPGQPFAAHWFPQELLKWSPETDPDAAYNRSAVPLAARFADPTTQVNLHARPGEARVVSLAAFGPTASNPSQGLAEFKTYAFTYWQYTDILVYWGGSSGEGLIVAPRPTVIDAAHRNGVPVLGTLFFPPVVYGGRIQWVRDLVQRKGATFPVADKLIEAAKYLGFDGWFFNQETAGGDAALAADLHDLLLYMRRKSSLHIMWYDAMTKDGNVRWQGALNAANQTFFQDQRDQRAVSDTMFLDFRWRPARLASSRTTAQTLGRNPYDLYAGIDVEANGYNTNANWSAIFPEAQPNVVSLGFYRPDWTFSQAANETDFVRRDNHFWVGPNGDPGNTQTAENWKGVAHYIPEKSPLLHLPFVTDFNTGQGHLYAVDGKVVAQGDWNNLSLQDVLPTWRWHMEGPGAALIPALDTAEAYEGGASLRVAGDLNGVQHLKLFSTRLPIRKDTHLRLVYKTGRREPTHLQVGLAFADAPDRFTYLDVDPAPTPGWNTAVFALRPFQHKTLSVISLRFSSDVSIPNYVLHVGRLAVLDGTPRRPAPPSRLSIEKQWPAGSGRLSLRLRWQAAPGKPACYYVYRKNSDGSRSYLGGTPNNAYFVAALERDGTEAAATLEVEAVGASREHSSPVSIQSVWHTL